jgi:hypothetical protein
MKKEYNNKRISRVNQNGKNGTYISEVQNFDTPEGYEDAFERYYPKENTQKDK